MDTEQEERFVPYNKRLPVWLRMRLVDRAALAKELHVILLPQVWANFTRALGF